MDLDMNLIMAELASLQYARANKREAKNREKGITPRAPRVSKDVTIVFFTLDRSGFEIPVTDSEGNELSYSAETCHEGEELATRRMFEHPWISRAEISSAKLGIVSSLDRTRAVHDYMRRDKFRHQFIKGKR